MKNIRLGLIILATLIFTTFVQAAQYFDARTEFPVLFFDAEERSKIENLSEAKVSEKVQLMEKAVGSILNRMTMPIVDSAGEIQSVRLIPYINEYALEKSAGDLKLHAAGGVVRSTIAYVYAEMYKEWLNQKDTFNPGFFLAQMASEKGDIPSLNVRGIGSDFDILYEIKNGKPAANYSKIVEDILNIINSTETKLNLFDYKDDLKKTLLTVGDLKEINQQIKRATSQGGSTLDFLTYDIGEGRLQEPSFLQGTISDLVRGYINYIDPVSKSATEDPAKQMIRGFRPLLELPFVIYKDETVLRNELVTLAKTALSPRAEEQITKLVRNARFSAANNRFYRGSENSLEFQINTYLKNKSQLQNIPRYIDFNSLNFRDEKNGFKEFPKELLMPRASFDKLTNNGVLYHGTPTIGSGLSIMRSGLFESSSKQGTAMFGRGAYTTPDYSTAEGYKSAEGLIFKIQVKDHPNINIIDWNKIEKTAFIKDLVKTAKEEKIDTFEYLSKIYGIDIIVNSHVLVQNQNAVILPTTINDIFNSQVQRIQSDKTKMKERIEAIEFLSKFSFYGKVSGSKVESLNSLLVDLLRKKTIRAEELLLLFTRETVSIEHFKLEEIFIIKEIFQNELSKLNNQYNSKSSSYIKMIAKSTEAEMKANKFYFDDEKIRKLILESEKIKEFPLELKLFLLGKLDHYTSSEIQLAQRLAKEKLISVKLTAAALLYKTGADKDTLKSVLIAYLQKNNSKHTSSHFDQFLEIMKEIKTHDTEIKSLFLEKAKQLKDYNSDTEGFIKYSGWFTDLTEISQDFDKFNSKDVAYRLMSSNSKFQRTNALDDFMNDQANSKGINELLSFLLKTENKRILETDTILKDKVRLFQTLAANISTVSKMNNYTLLRYLNNDTVTFDLVFLNYLKNHKAKLSADSVFSVLSKTMILKLDKTVNFLKTNKSVLQEQFTVDAVQSLIRMDPNFFFLVEDIEKFRPAIFETLKDSNHRIPEDVLKNWLVNVIQRKNSSAAVFKYVVSDQFIKSTNWLEVAEQLCKAHPKYLNDMILMPTMNSSNKKLVQQLQKKLGQKGEVNKAALMRLDAFDKLAADHILKMDAKQFNNTDFNDIFRKSYSLYGTKLFADLVNHLLMNKSLYLKSMSGFNQLAKKLPMDIEAELYFRHVVLNVEVSNSSYQQDGILSYFSIYTQEQKDQLVDRYISNNDVGALSVLLRNNLVASKQGMIIDYFYKLNNPKLFYNILWHADSTLVKWEHLNVFTKNSEELIALIFKHQIFNEDSMNLLVKIYASKKDSGYFDSTHFDIIDSILRSKNFSNKFEWITYLVGQSGFRNANSLSRLGFVNNFHLHDFDLKLTEFFLKNKDTQVAMMDKIRVALGYGNSSEVARARDLFTELTFKGYDMKQIVLKSLGSDSFKKHQGDLIEYYISKDTSSKSEILAAIKKQGARSLFSKINTGVFKNKCMMLF